MEKKAWMTLLLDFYGPLLTEHQRRAVELSCGEDYSLAEIAESQGISRQGVRDTLMRGEKALQALEDKLHVSIPDEELANMKTVGDLAAYVEANV